MAFLPIGRTLSPSRPVSSSVRIYRARDPRNSRHMRIALSRPVVERLRWQAGDRMMISFGIEDDFGKILVSKIRVGGLKLCDYQMKVGKYQILSTLPIDGVGGFDAVDILNAIPMRAMLDHAYTSTGLMINIPELRALKRPALQVAS